MYTRADTYAVKGFSPLVSVPLEELIENYGEPNFGWLTQVDTTEPPNLGMVLDWSSINMYAELPQIASTTYTVQEMTDIERIIFFDEGEGIGVDGKTFTEEKLAWIGYGNYQL